MKAYMIIAPQAKKPSTIDCYTVVQTLGSGSTAKVKLVQDPFSGNLYAAKIIKLLPTFSHFHYRSMILSEVRCLRSTSHKNIVRLINYKESGSYLSKTKGFYSCMYLILEYCPHGELFQLLKKNGSLTEDITLYYFSQIIDALESCNTSGYNHGDLKPENLLIGDNYDLKVVDFGYSSKIGKNVEIVGTKQYLPPEVLLNLKVDPMKSDLFSAGVVLFIMYLGCPPFKSAHPEDVHYDLLRNRKELFWAYFQRKLPSKSFDSGFKQLIEGLLEFEPAQRFSYKEVHENTWVQKLLNEQQITQAISQLIE